MKTHSGRFASSILIALVVVGLTQSSAWADPFKLGVEERGYIENPNGGGQEQYPSPEMVPTGQPLQGNANQNHTPKKKPPPPRKPPQPLQGGAMESVPQQRPPMQMQIQQTVQLPAGFMGAWVVSGLRQQVEAQPQFQAAIPQIFQSQTQDVWTISGNPNSGYAFANEAGVRTAIYVDKVQGNTAFIRYQHPIKNTMAQEAIVMEIAPGGAQFKGLERISIVKQGEPVRAKVTYQLMGRRR